MSETKYVRGSHCSWCGFQFLDPESEKPTPKPVTVYAKCGHCQNQTWISPMPVAVLVLPVVDEDGRIGVLLGRRGIQPKKGEWGLPGGYLNQDETIEQGASRETWEETTLRLSHDRPLWITHSGISTGAAKQVIVFVETTPIPIALLPVDFTPTDETEAIKVVYEPIELCFSTHTEALRRYFERLRASR